MFEVLELLAVSFGWAGPGARWMSWAREMGEGVGAVPPTGAAAASAPVDWMSATPDCPGESEGVFVRDRVWRSGRSRRTDDCVDVRGCHEKHVES